MFENEELREMFFNYLQKNWSYEAKVMMELMGGFSLYLKKEDTRDSTGYPMYDNLDYPVMGQKK